MKKQLLAIMAVTGMALGLAACSSNYVLHTNDGRTIVTQGKPSVDSDTGMILYKDSNGIKQQLNRSDVKSLTEVGQ